MKRKVRTVKTTATALTSPSPARVSVCGAGANQTPFNAIKSEGLTLVEKKDLPPMIQSLKSQGYDVVSFAFKGDAWTADAVTGWLTEGGYVGFKMEGADGDFVVSSETPADWMADAEKRDINTDDGVTVTVGKMPVEAPEPVTGGVEAAAEAGSDVQPVAADKAEGVPGGVDANTTVVDDGGTSIVEPETAEKGVDPHSVLADGENPSPEPAPEPVADATETVVAKTLVEVLREAGIGVEGEVATKGLWEVTRAAELVQSLKWLVNDLDYEKAWGSVEVNDARDQAMSSLKAASVNLLAAFEVLVKAEVAAMAAVIADKSDGSEADAPAVVVAADAAVETIQEDPVAAAVAKAMAPFAEVLAQVQKQLAAPEAVVTEKSDTSVTPVAEPVRQTRKSEDTDAPAPAGTPATKDEQNASSRIASLRFRGGLGL